MSIKSYVAWDASVRWFHWINLLCIIGLMAIGIVILNSGALARISHSAPTTFADQAW